ncbi:MAG: prepilin peptidase [Candidatus Zixiibacteriota bacterium]|jgi:leader peptidase (prepilin peptidase)/N-methyltransferase
MFAALQIGGVAAAFFVGALVGNFYHLIVHRLPGGRFRIVLPPACPSCGRAERRIWMLPLLWYPLLRGRCPRCGYRYRKNLVLWELASGAVAALLFYYYGFSLAFATTFTFCVFFLMNYWVEFRYGVLVPRLYFPALGIGLALSFLPGSPGPADAAVGGLLGLGLVLALRPGRELFTGAARGGERMLAVVALGGVFLGWQSAVFILAVGALAALVVPLMGRRKGRGDAESAFGLAVLAATLVMTFFHGDVTAWYFRVR